MYGIERDISVIIFSVSVATECATCKNMLGQDACEQNGAEETCDVNGDEVRIS